MSSPSTATALEPGTALLAFLLLSSIKWLLVPTYRSTDFDVHRNWLAVTRHLPLSEWYFDDVGGTTVHTLDYPPLFAFFEYASSNNPVTDSLLRSGWLDERCLELLPDYDNDPSERCVRFHRATVILSDVVLFLGAYLATKSVAAVDEGCRRAQQFIFLMIVTNPGLMMLDHVHFQYNGMMLGVLLISIACIVRGTSSRRYEGYVAWELLGAASFASLLAMKHLYLTLAPLYFFYLLGRYCFVVADGGKEDEKKKKKKKKKKKEPTLQFSLKRLVVLASVTLVCFLGPFVPFLMQSDPVGQVQQILRRLFPFGRGLVHDYWAANVWALYLFASRVATFAFRRAPIPNSIRVLVDHVVPFPEPKPSLVALLLLIGIWPGGVVMAWKVGRRSLIERLSNAGEIFVHAVVFCSLSGFMLGYHVHEKAIMTAIVPLTLLAASSRHAARLFVRTCMFGVFGILPLLFRTDELLLKVLLYVSWMCGAIYGLERIHCLRVLTPVDYFSFVLLAFALIFMEIVHPILFMPSGRLEFLPLMITSVMCSVGLLWCWADSYHSVIATWR